MKHIPVSIAKAKLSQLLDEALEGEQIVITRRNRPAVRLVPVDQEEPKRTFGSLAGQIHMDDSFFDPLPDAELDAWES